MFWERQRKLLTSAFPWGRSHSADEFASLLKMTARPSCRGPYSDAPTSHLWVYPVLDSSILSSNKITPCYMPVMLKLSTGLWRRHRDHRRKVRFFFFPFRDVRTDKKRKENKERKRENASHKYMNFSISIRNLFSEFTLFLSKYMLFSTILFTSVVLLFSYFTKLDDLVLIYYPRVLILTLNWLPCLSVSFSEMSLFSHNLAFRMIVRIWKGVDTPQC